MKILARIASLLFCLIPYSAQAQLSIGEVASKNLPAVVVIESQSTIGSGVIVDSTGIIATNFHVIDDGENIAVSLENGDVYTEISVVDYDERKDIALLKVRGFDLPTADLGNSNSAGVGDEVVVMGTPEGLEQTVTTGILSAVRDSGDGYSLFQTDAAISPGSSGGGMFNRAGELIGITVSTLENAQNINFVIPINYVRGMITEEVKYTWEEFVAASSPNRTSIISSQVNFGDDSSTYANDQECDDPRFEGSGMASTLLAQDELRDASDCRALFNNGSIRLKAPTPASMAFGVDSGEYSEDGECDDPRFEGSGMAMFPSNDYFMKDATDCSAAFETGTVQLKRQSVFSSAQDLITAYNQNNAWGLEFVLDEGVWEPKDEEKSEIGPFIAEEDGALLTVYPAGIEESDLDLDLAKTILEANWSLQNIKFGLVDGSLLIKHEAPIWALSVDYFDEVITSIYAASIFALDNFSLLSSNEEPSQSGNSTGPRALKEDISLRSRTTAQTFLDGAFSLRLDETKWKSADPSDLELDGSLYYYEQEAMYLQVIPEALAFSITVLEGIAISNAESTLSDFEIIQQSDRNVNGLSTRFLKTRGTSEEIDLAYEYLLYSGDGEIIQCLIWTIAGNEEALSTNADEVFRTFRAN